MKYFKHYAALIARARQRNLDSYTEKHHIIPRCLGGTDDSENIVSLTPEEHYVAHQLLVKMHPDNRKLVHAAIMMIPDSKHHSRNNKLYGWLRKKYFVIARQRIGKKNGSFGKPWYHDPKTGKAGKFLPGTEPACWKRGRVSGLKVCIICSSEFEINKGLKTKTCSDKCKHVHLSNCAKKSSATQLIPINPDTVAEIIERRDAGESLRSLAPEYNLNAWTIYDIVARYKKNTGCSTA